jgi:hypothetical protein
MNFGRGFKLGIALLSGALLLSGCGTASQKYGSDSKDGVYFAVPNSWKIITSKDLAAQEALSTTTGAAERMALVRYQVAFTPDAKVKAKDVLTLNTPESPIVYARVRALTNSEIQQVSYNDLRNLILPLTSWEDGTSSSIPIYNVISDQEAVQKGGRGVHTVFAFTNNGASQTINQTGLLSNDHRTLVMFVVRCSTACYNKNKKVIEKTVASLTDRGPH